MSKPHVHLNEKKKKISAKFQKDRTKTVGGVALIAYMDGRTHFDSRRQFTLCNCRGDIMDLTQ